MKPLQVPQPSEDVKLKATTDLLIGELRMSVGNKIPLMAKFDIGQKVCLIYDIELGKYAEYEVEAITFVSRDNKPRYKLAGYEAINETESTFMSNLVSEQSLVEAKYCDITSNYNK